MFLQLYALRLSSHKLKAYGFSASSYIKEYSQNPSKYLPLHPYAFAKDKSGMGWNCGILEDNRPYFVDAWFDYGCAFADIFIPEARYEKIK